MLLWTLQQLFVSKVVFLKFWYFQVCLELWGKHMHMSWALFFTQLCVSISIINSIPIFSKGERMRCPFKVSHKDYAKSALFSGLFSFWSGLNNVSIAPATLFFFSIQSTISQLWASLAKQQALQLVVKVIIPGLPTLLMHEGSVWSTAGSLHY